MTALPKSMPASRGNSCSKEKSSSGLYREYNQRSAAGNYIHYFYDDTNTLGLYESEWRNHAGRSGQNKGILESEKRKKRGFQNHTGAGEAVPGDFKAFPSKAVRQSLPAVSIFFFTPFQKQLKGIERLTASLQISSKQAPFSMAE